MTQEFFTGDTERVRVTFTDSANALVDADDNEVFLTVYDAEDITVLLLDAGTATRSSAGVYYYDYTMPDEPMKLILEMRGLFGTKPQLERTRIKVKFRIS